MLAGLAKEDGKTGKEGGTRARRTTVGSTVAAVGYVSVGSTVAGVGTGFTGTGPGSPATLASVFIYATFYAPSVTVA